jgi:xanthine dehydrogenase accessory factor
MHLYRQLQELLATGERLALATIIDQSGSGPRGPGAKMIRRKNGPTIGSIGGGILEAQVQRWAEEVLHTGQPLCRQFTLTPNQAANSGMICGGRLEILVDYFDGGDALHLQLFSTISTLLNSRRRGCLITQIIEAAGEIKTFHGLFSPGMPVFYSAEGGSDIPAELMPLTSLRQPSLCRSGNRRYFFEPLTPAPLVYIFGAGHISQKLVPLCRLVGFNTIVLDDRADFACPENFPEADEIVVLDSWNQPQQNRDLGADSFVVIVTRGHAHDQTVLARFLRSKVAYIGMIGSRHKRDTIYQNLLAQGFAGEDLQRVFCPIGLSIGAETPEEIAVSIVAQLIALRAGLSGQ